MNNHSLHTLYLSEGTAGHAIVRKFHSRYADVLTAISLINLHDVVHEVFLSLSKTNFNDVRNLEHYIMRAIKLQCWSLLDKAIKQKAAIIYNEELYTDEGENKHHHQSLNTAQSEQLHEIEGSELLIHINLFKNQLKIQDVNILNLLIDGVERSEIAVQLGMNFNTLDTNIRRLRIKLADHLRSLGYYYNELERFS